jgi:hypothetical protein
VPLVRLLDAIVPVREIAVGGKVDDRGHRVAQPSACSLPMVVVGVQTDAAARGDFIPRLVFDVPVCAKDVVKPIEVVPGATDGRRGRDGR